MEDRVAEVLAQRAALDTGAAAGIALSVVLHVGITAGLVWLAVHQPPPQMINTLTIKFAPMTDASASKRPVPVAPRIHEAPPVVEAPPKPPAAKPAVPEKNTAPPSPFGRSTKRASEIPAPPPPAPVLPAGAQSTADIAIGSSGVTGLEGGDFPYTVYIENMKRLIGTNWFRPQVAAGAASTVYFVIERGGTVRDAKTEIPSGNGTFDRAALRAVLSASPLPPLPLTYTGSYLGVHLTFK